MRYSKDKKIHELVKALIAKFGWAVKSKNAHLKIYHEERKLTLMVPQTPSDGRAVLNFFADVKRAGFVPSDVLSQS